MNPLSSALQLSERFQESQTSSWDTAPLRALARNRRGPDDVMTGMVGYSDNRTPGLRGIVSARSCHWQLLEGVAGESSISVSIRRAAPLLATHKMKHMLEVIASWLLIERRSCAFVFFFFGTSCQPKRSRGALLNRAIGYASGWQALSTWETLSHGEWVL